MHYRTITDRKRRKKYTQTKHLFVFDVHLNSSISATDQAIGRSVEKARMLLLSYFFYSVASFIIYTINIFYSLSEIAKQWEWKEFSKIKMPRFKRLKIWHLLQSSIKSWRGKKLYHKYWCVSFKFVPIFSLYNLWHIVRH